jgi:hypothetical protein
VPKPEVPLPIITDVKSISFTVLPFTFSLKTPVSPSPKENAGKFCTFEP